MEKTSNNKLCKIDLPIILYLIIITFIKGLGLDSDNKLYLYFTLLSFIIGILRFFKNFKKPKYFILVLSLILIGFINMIVGKTNTVLFTGINILLLYGLDYKNAFKIVLDIRFISFAFILVSVFLGFVDNNVITHFRDGQFILRNCLGFSHPNIAHMSLIIIIVLYLYVYIDKLKKRNFIFLLFINYFIYSFTLCRTGFLVGCIAILLFLFIKYLKSEMLLKRMLIIFKYSYVLFFSVSIISAFLYPSLSIISNLDFLFAGRLSYMSQILFSYTPSLIGKNYSLINSSLFIDNGFINLLYQGGLISTFIISFFIIKLSNKLYRNSDVYGLLIIFIFSMYGLTESFYMNFIMNPILMMIPLRLLKENDYE